MQAETSTNTVSKKSTSSKHRETERRNKQRQQTAKSRKAPRQKPMTRIAEAKAARLAALAASSDYMTTREAAAYLKLSRQYLEGARYRGDGSGPPYVKLERAVRYRKATLDAWMAAHDHAPDVPIERSSGAGRAA